MQLAQVRAANCVAHGDQYIQAGLDQHPFIDRNKYLAFGLVLVGQNPGGERRNAVQPVWQESERALAGLRDDARNAAFLGEDFEREENLKIHERRLRHVPPPVRFWARVSAADRTGLWAGSRRRASCRPEVRFWAQVRLSLRACRFWLFLSLRQSPLSCRARFPGSL